MEKMTRYVILIPHDRLPIVVPCRDGGEVGLKELQEYVGGWIEYADTVLPQRAAHEDVDKIKIVVNEEAMWQRLPENLIAGALAKYQNTILGDAVLVAVRGEDTVGFTLKATSEIRERLVKCCEEVD